MYAFPCIKEPFLSLSTLNIPAQSCYWFQCWYLVGVILQGCKTSTNWLGEASIVGFSCTQAQAPLGNIRVVVVYKSVPWSNQLYGKISQTLVLLSVCVLFGKFSHCDNNKSLRSFGIFQKKSNFFLNAKILEKFAKLWKPQFEK